MNQEKAFSAFLSELMPRLEEYIGAHVQVGLEVAKTMALRMEMYSGTTDTSRGTQQQKGQGG